MTAAVEEHPDRRPIARLRRVAAALARLELPHPADIGWLVAGAQRYEAAGRVGMALTMDGALGLGAAGRAAWRLEELRQRRDDLLRELHQRHFPDLSPGRAASAICALARLVELDGPAAVSADDRCELVREALLRGQTIPGHRQVKRILETGHEMRVEMSS